MEQKTTKQVIEHGAEFRHFQIDAGQRAGDDQENAEDNRTISVRFSSNTRVPRMFGDEILDHQAESVRLDRMTNGAAVLVDHQRNDQVGVVEQVELDESEGRANLRFGKSARAQEILDDIRDGIRNFVSVGYWVHRAVMEERNDDGPDVFRVVDWEPFEISIVSVPADPRAEIARSAGTSKLTLESLTMNENTTTTGAEETRASAPAAAAPQINEAQIRQDAQNAERARIREITAIGRQFDVNDLADEHCLQATSVADFRELVLDKIATRDPVEARPATHLDLSQRDLQQYSLFRAVNACLNRNWDNAGFELECSREIQERLGGEAPKGFYVPWDVQTEQRAGMLNHNPVLQAAVREMTTGGVGTGAELVGTTHLASSFIEVLRASAVVGRLGARMLTGLTGNIDIPKQAGATTFAWIAESAAGGTNDIATGQVAMSPNTVAGGVPITRRLLKQASPDAENMIRADLAAGAALAMDLAAMEGAGGNAPQGIVGTSGVGAVTVTAPGVPDWAEAVEFETDVTAANAAAGNLAFVTTAAVRGNMKTTEKAANTARFIQEGNEVNGYPVLVSTQLSANRIIFGDWTQVVIGMWGVLDIVPDTATNVAEGGLILRAFQDADVGIRHGESFSVNA